MFRALFHQLPTSSARDIRNLIERRIPMGRVNLQGVVDRVTAEDRSALGIGCPENDVAGSVPGCRENGKVVIDRVVPINQLGLTGFDNGQHAVPESIAPLQTRICNRIGAGIAELSLDFREEILRVGEGRHPAAIDQLCVPSDVITMQMGAQYNVNLVRSHAGGAQSVQIGRIELVKARQSWSVLVVACAAVQQDRMVRGPDEPRMDAGD